jgi:hypothetical protein
LCFDIQISILGRGQPAKKSQPQVMADALLLDTEAAVMSSFAFLEPADVEMDDEDYMAEDMDMVSGNDADTMKHLKMKTKGVIVNDGEFRLIFNKLIFNSHIFIQLMMLIWKLKKY